VLSAEKNERLTQVGPGTPMGNLLRRYWWPILPARDLGNTPVQRRLLGEDWVLFRDGQDRIGILEAHCPHRRAALELGFCEQTGLRCGYHGWMYDVDGQCIDQPGEPEKSTFKHRIRARAGKLQEMGGLLFAYVGPEPAPLLPRYDLFVWDDVWRDIGHAVVPCNFLQIMENSVDPYHVEWLHGRYGSFLKEQAGEAPLEMLAKKHVKVAFDVFEHGILKRRILEGQTEEDEDWAVGHPLVFPHMLRIGGGGLSFFQIRVPIDDTHTWHVWYQTYKPADRAVPQQADADIPVYEVPLYDEDGEFIRDYVDGQDVMAWVTQGPVADRTTEHLGKSDLGVIALRRLYQEQIARVDAGEDPICVYRDPAANECIDLPQEQEKFGGGTEFRHEFLHGGQTRYSPMLRAVEELFGDAAPAPVAA
jgi:5,5'-dehydrodivanillate O-demethylase